MISASIARRTTDSKRRLFEALMFIEDNPTQWKQSSWRCNTGMCLFGTIADREPSVKWFSDDPEADFYNSDVVVPADPRVSVSVTLPEALQPFAGGVSVAVDASMSVEAYVKQLLKLSPAESDVLSYAENTLPMLRLMVADYISNKRIRDIGYYEEKTNK